MNVKLFPMPRLALASALRFRPCYSGGPLSKELAGRFWITVLIRLSLAGGGMIIYARPDMISV